MVWYNRGKFIMMDTAGVLGEAPFGLLLDRVIISLMKTTYAIDIDLHEQFNDTGVSTEEIVATGYVARGDAQQLVGKAIARDDGADRTEFDATDLVYTAIGNGANDTFDQIIVMREQDAAATDANTELLAHTTVSSTTTNGGNITLVFNVEGLLQLTA